MYNVSAQCLSASKECSPQIRHASRQQLLVLNAYGFWLRHPDNTYYFAPDPRKTEWQLNVQVHDHVPATKTPQPSLD
jgi:hypothetical protein